MIDWGINKVIARIFKQKPRLAYVLLVVIAFGFTVGCQMQRSNQERQDAEDWFKDQHVIELVKAVEKGDVDTIDRLVADGVDINAKGRNDMTPLYRAITVGNKEGYAALLRHGASPNARPQVGRVQIAVMHLAATKKDSYWLQEALAHGGDPNLGDISRDGTVDVPLNYAIDVGVGSGDDFLKPFADNVRLLLEAGADPNGAGGGVDPPLTAALGNQHYETVYLLIKHNAELAKTPISGYDLVEYVKSMDDGLDAIQPDQLEWFWKVVDLLNERGAKIDKTKFLPTGPLPPDPLAAEGVVDSVGVPGPIEFDGTTYHLVSSLGPIDNGGGQVYGQIYGISGETFPKLTKEISIYVALNDKGGPAKSFETFLELRDRKANSDEVVELNRIKDEVRWPVAETLIFSLDRTTEYERHICRYETFNRSFTDPRKNGYMNFAYTERAFKGEDQFDQSVKEIKNSAEAKSKAFLESRLPRVFPPSADGK